MSYADYVRERMKNTLRTETAEAEGNPITITDGLSRTFKGIKVFGESTQNGTPTPLVPIDIVSVDNPTLTVGDETLTQTQATTIPHTLSGIEVPSSYVGYTYTKGGKCYVADYVYKQGGMVYKVENTSESTANVNNVKANSPYLGTMTAGGSADGNGGITVKNGETIQYILATPIITDITDTPEAQTLLDLHTYRGTTNVSLDTNLGYIQTKYVKK